MSPPPSPLAAAAAAPICAAPVRPRLTAPRTPHHATHHTPRTTHVCSCCCRRLGCITLETYIGQFHTWLLTKRPDGQPIYLLTLLPGYPLLNFAVVTAVYVGVSFRLFVATNALKGGVG